MRTLIKFSFVFMLLALATTSCKNKKATKAGEAVETKAAPTSAAKSYSVSSGTVHWTGSKVAYDHKGTLNVESGVLSAEGNMIKSGDFVIDMASLANTDIADATESGKLVGHLKSPDFFDVATYPKATFSITSVAAVDTEEANCNITGNLTLKGVTKSITFPALVMAKDGGLTAISDKFTINRNDWGVQYGTGLAGAIGDKIISENVDLKIELAAK